MLSILRSGIAWTVGNVTVLYCNQICNETFHTALRTTIFSTSALFPLPQTHAKGLEIFVSFSA